MGEGAASSSPCQLKMCSTGTVTLFDFIAHQAILHTPLVTVTRAAGGEGNWNKDTR